MSMLSNGIQCMIRRVATQAQALLPQPPRIALPEVVPRACRRDLQEPTMEVVEAGLRDNDNETFFLTINPFGFSDSILLGTDCDPFCYDNAWIHSGTG